MDEQALRPRADRHRAVSESVRRCVMMIPSNKVKKYTGRDCPVLEASSGQPPNDRALLGKGRPRAEIRAV